MVNSSSRSVTTEEAKRLVTETLHAGRIPIWMCYTRMNILIIESYHPDKLNQEKSEPSCILEIEEYDYHQSQIAWLTLPNYAVS